jgi:hypothetical protein
MTLHCSSKLVAKLCGVSPIPFEETSPLGSWHSHLSNQMGQLRFPEQNRD